MAGQGTDAWPVTFSDIAEQAGLRHPSIYGGVETKRFILETNGCGTGLIDFDRDGWLDALVLSGTRLDESNRREKTWAEAERPLSRLYRNKHDGTFEDVTARVGLDRIGWASSVCAGDYDNDGWLDLFVANGAVNIVEKLRGEPVPYRMRNLLFHNLGAGTFAETSSHGGVGFDRAEVSRAAVFGDIDNDGDTDVLVTTNSGPVRLWLNQVGTHRSWLQVRLDNGDRNRLALGALVRVERAGERPLVRRVRTDGSYLAAQDPTLQFGLGEWRDPVTVCVDWPGGESEQWTFLQVNRRVALTRGQGKPASPSR